MNMMDIYSNDNDSVFFTDNPIYDSDTGKEIRNGVEVLDNNKNNLGLFEFNRFLKEKLNRFLYKNETVFIRMIINNSKPSKSIVTKERYKLTYKLRYEVLKRDKFSCVLCGITGKDSELEVDHKIPVSRGGLTTKLNLQTLCFKCNSGKSNG